MMASTQLIAQIQARLLTWYRQQRRNLPWRNETSPYRIWISEVMLQQTQVNTVIPYYRRFLEKFADVEALAAAPLAEVLKAWEGLGYYARARNLHQAAVEIVKKYGGRLPETYAELRVLPGFGDYTAGAVAAVAFGQAVPAVDGNVKRVIARLFALKTDLTRAPAAQELKQIATALVASEAPGDWTQAIMELGATTCLPKRPRCDLCPVGELCKAHLSGLEQSLPLKPAKKVLPHYDVTAAVIAANNTFLIAQRPLKGMLGGLWEFPGGKQQPGETLVECLRREIEEELGVEIEVGQPIVTVKHSYTHFKITLHAFHCRLAYGQLQNLGVAAWRWVTVDEMAAYAFSRADLKIIEALKQKNPPPG
jgi:A/G-specific adenine glycosylase